ncbi:MAG: HAD hydrolase family protein, partial [Trichococcus flocculiformis]
KKTLTSDEVQEIYEFGKGFSAGTLLVGEHHYYSLEDEVTEEMQKDATLVNMDISVLDPKAVTEEMGLMKILYIGEPNEVDVIDSAIPDKMRDDFYIVRSQDFLMEVMALGDGENDYEMIQVAGLGVVMSNGTDNLKSIANEITLSNEEDGVAHAIERWAFQS